MKYVSLVKQNSHAKRGRNVGSHLFPEGGTEQTRTAPARYGCENSLSETEPNSRELSRMEKSLKTSNYNKEVLHHESSKMPTLQLSMLEDRD